MNRERAKELLPIIQAYAEGKEVQTRHNDQEDDWFDTPDPEWYSVHDHRIKPEPREWWIVRRNGEYPVVYLNVGGVKPIDSDATEIVLTKEVIE